MSSAVVDPGTVVPSATTFASVGTQQAPEAAAIGCVSLNVRAGPPNSPAAFRVSTSRHGVSV